MASKGYRRFKNRLVGEHNINMKANDILSKGTKREIVQSTMEEIFQQLENERSTINLSPKIKNKLGLTIEQALIDAAIPYLETRHIFVTQTGNLAKISNVNILM